MRTYSLQALGICKLPRKDKRLEAEAANLLNLLPIYGRDGVIRTLDPMHPMHVRYQAALRPENLL
jgi:hypothetical protein